MASKDVALGAILDDKFDFDEFVESVRKEKAAAYESELRMVAARTLRIVVRLFVEDEALSPEERPNMHNCVIYGQKHPVTGKKNYLFIKRFIEEKTQNKLQITEITEEFPYNDNTMWNARLLFTKNY